MSPARAASNALLREWCPQVKGAVLSIGSSSDQDGDGKRYRDYFTNAVAYVTSEPCPGCDVVADVRWMPHVPSHSFDAVFCSGVFEHVDDYQAGVSEIYRVLTLKGVLLLGVPFQQALHRAPQDFWRFTEYGVRWMLRQFERLEIVAIGDDPKFPSCYWARAWKGTA